MEEYNSQPTEIDSQYWPWYPFIRRLIIYVLIAIGLVVLFQRVLPNEWVQVHRDVWAAFFTTFGVIYAIFTGFIFARLITRWNLLNRATQDGITAIANICDLLIFIKKADEKKKILKSLKEFMKEEVHKVWIEGESIDHISENEKTKEKSITQSDENEDVEEDGFIKKSLNYAGALATKTPNYAGKLVKKSPSYAVEFVKKSPGYADELVRQKLIQKVILEQDIDRCEEISYVESPKLKSLIKNIGNIDTGNEKTIVVWDRIIEKFAQIEACRTRRLTLCAEHLSKPLPVLIAFMSIVLVIGLALMSVEQILIHFFIVGSLVAALYTLYIVIMDLDYPLSGHWHVDDSLYDAILKKLNHMLVDAEQSEAHS